MADTIRQALDRRKLLAHVALTPPIDELLAALESADDVPEGNDVGGTVTLAAKKTLGVLALDLTPPAEPVAFRLITDPAAHSFRFWLALNSAAPALPLFEFATGTAGVVLTPATKQTTAGEEHLVAAPGDVRIAGIAVALLIEGSPTQPTTVRFSPTVGAPPGIVELQLVPGTVLLGDTGFGFELPTVNGTAGAFVIDDSTVAAPPGQTVLNGTATPTRADDPAWRGLAIRNARFYIPRGAPLLGGHAVDAFIEIGTAPGDGIDLALSTRVPPKDSRPGIAVTIECRDPAATGLQDFVPTLVEAAMELPLDGMNQPAPGGGFTMLAGTPVIARLRLARSTGAPETRATLAIESQGPNGVLSIAAPDGGPGARVVISAAALATAIVADKAPTGADTGGVVMHALLVAALGLSAALQNKGRLTIHKVELGSSGHGVPVGEQVKLLLDYSVDVLVKPIKVGVIAVEMRDEQPMRVRNRNVGLRLNLSNPAASGVETVELDFSRADMEIEDPGAWMVDSPGSLFDILGTRSGRGSTWLEVDLRFKVNLGPVQVSGATIRATLNDNGTVTAALRGLDASLAVPGVIEGRGAIQLLENGGFTAALDINLVPLNLATDGVILYQEREGTFWLFVQIGVDLPGPIPLANSGLGIYGISGAFGFNARPKPPAPNDPDPIGYQLRWDSADPLNAFEFRGDTVTVGGQAVIGTVPDLGFSFSTRAGLFITAPDVVVRGALWATLLSPRMGVTDKPAPGSAGVSFMGVVVVDPNEAITIGLKGELNVPVVLNVTIPLGARFPTVKAESDNWFIYLGTDGYRDAVPADGRGLGPMRATVFPELIGMGADAYLMMRGRGIQKWPRGGQVTIADGLVLALGFGFEYTIGVKPVAWADVHASADILLATRPLTLAGFGTAGGSLNLGPFSVGVDATITLLSVENADPFIHAKLCGHIDLFFTEIEGCVEVSIGSEPTVAVPPPDVHPLDDLVNGEVVGPLAFLIDHQYRRIATLATQPANLPQVWPDTLLHLSFAVSPELAAGYVAKNGAAAQFTSIDTYPVGLAAQPIGSDMLRYEWTLTSLGLFDVTGDLNGPGTLVDGPLSAAWQAGKDGDLGKRPQAGDLVLLTFQNDLFLNRLADAGTDLPSDPLATAADACHAEVQAGLSWAVGYVAAAVGSEFLLPADPLSPDPCVSRFTALLTEHASVLPNLPLNVQTAALMPPPFDYAAPSLEAFANPLQLERAFAGALVLSLVSGVEGRTLFRVAPFQSAVIVPEEPLTAARLWVIIDGPIAAGAPEPVSVTDNQGNAWTVTERADVLTGRTALRFAPRGTGFIAFVDVRWPAGRRLAVLGLGGITAKAQAAAAARNNAVKAEAAKQQAAAAKQPQQKDDTKGGDVVCVLTPGHTYRLDVGMEWEGWIYRQNEDGKKEEAGHLAGQTTYLPKGADPNNPPGTARSFFFRTTPKPSASDTTAAVAVLPIYGQKDFVKALRVQRNLFRPEMLSRYLLGYSPAQTETARFGDDPVDAHFAAAHVTTLASVYGFDLTLDLRRVDVPGNEGLPVTLTPNWVALKEPKLLTGLDARRIDLASTAACPMPKPGATLSGKPLAPLEREAWYEVYALAKSKDPTNVLDGRLDGVTFRTSRWRNPAEMIDGLGFKSSPAGATGDIELRHPLPSVGSAAIDDSDADFEAALDAIGLDGWPAAPNPRVSLLWQPQATASGPSWLCAGLLVESPEPIHRPGRVRFESLALVMSPPPAGAFDIRRTDRSRSRMLWLCSTPFAPRITLRPRPFLPPLRVLPRVALTLVDETNGATLTGSVRVPLAPSFAEEA